MSSKEFCLFTSVRIFLLHPSIPSCEHKGTRRPSWLPDTLTCSAEVCRLCCAAQPPMRSSAVHGVGLNHDGFLALGIEEPSALRVSLMGRAELPVLLHSQATGVSRRHEFFTVCGSGETFLNPLPNQWSWRHLNKAAFGLLSQPCLRSCDDRIPLPLVHREEEEVFYFPPGAKGRSSSPDPARKRHFTSWPARRRRVVLPMVPLSPPTWFGLCL